MFQEIVLALTPDEGDTAEQNHCYAIELREAAVNDEREIPTEGNANLTL